MIFQTVRLWKLRRKTKKIEKTFIQHRHRLANQDRIQIDALINETFSRISRKDAAGAITSFEKLNEACHRYLSLPLVLRFGLYTVGLAVTIVVALIIRQTWFELYEIPSGSMRPTLKENDRLAVSKTTFGLNIPMKPKHLFFDEKLPKRGSIVVFTGNGMNIENNRTNYFYLFPGYKQYVKRLIGLPGDSLYFYGGKIYGIDKEGQDTKLHEILTPNEHIPFIYLEGNIRSNRQTNSYYGTSYIYQMNSPIAKITEEVFGHFKGSLISKQKVEDLYELYGMENFATSRIVPKEMVSDPFYRKAGAEYFLELTHHPSIRQIDLDYDHALHHGPRPHVEMSYIPLSETQLRHIFDALYSARFQVIGGRMYPLSAFINDANRSIGVKPPFSLEDGKYEIQNGIAYKVKTQGLVTPLPENHPLRTFTPELTFLLYNASIECVTHYLPRPGRFTPPPARYAYFRSGDLYLMGSPVLTKGDAKLKEFIAIEEQKARSLRDYIPFIDLGPPLLEDGTLDVQKIQSRGFKVASKRYFVLGDNHAMSADTRHFGLVPEGSLRGTPLFFIWAPGSRLGFINKGIYAFFSSPATILAWVLFILFLIPYFYLKWRKKSLRELIYELLP